MSADCPAGIRSAGPRFTVPTKEGVPSGAEPRVSFGLSSAAADGCLWVRQEGLDGCGHEGRLLER